MLDYFASNGIMQITHDNYIQFKGNDGLEFIGTYIYSGKTYYSKGIRIMRTDLNKIRAYLIFAGSLNQVEYENNYKKFINSFEITN